jgi:hypothetical protein
MGLGMALFGQTNALPRLAVVEFSTNNNTAKTRQDAVTVRNLVESQMIAVGKYQIITRDEIDKLLANQRIQVSSISSAGNIRKLQLQNINYIVTGSVDSMGSDYAVTVKILDVSTGQFSHSANDFMGGGSRNLYTGITTLMSKFTSGMSSRGEPVESNKEYKIGDFGPAKGIVFYDKGVFSNGWRYLEAAPADSEPDTPPAEWGVYGQSVGGTSEVVGSGKQNTQLIIDRLKQLGESGKAAQLCARLEFGGYNDWFLPSKDELNLMYQNLRRKGLGGFSDNWYWSSSQDSSSYAWVQGFRYGTQANYYKYNTYCVHAIRAF